MSKCEKCSNELNIRIGVDGDLDGAYVLKDFMFKGCRNLVCKDCLERLSPKTGKCNSCFHEQVCQYKNDFQRFESNYKAGQGYGNGVIFEATAECSAFVAGGK